MEQKMVFKNICIFEDERYANFLPLSLDRPVFDLDIGSSSIRFRLIDETGAEDVILLCRPYLAETVLRDASYMRDDLTVRVNEAPETETFFINGRFLAMGDDGAVLFEEVGLNEVVHKNGIPVAALLSEGEAAGFYEYLSRFVKDEGVTRLVQEIRKVSSSGGEETAEEDKIEVRINSLRDWSKGLGVELKETRAKLLSHIWQLIGDNSICITDDFRRNPLRGTAPDTELFRGVDIINEDDIIIGSDVEVKSGTVLDASEGPIIIEDRARIEPNAILYGPCFVGEGAIVRGGAKIGHGTSIGRYCRIGGEVEESIFSPYTNKQHEGFIGHSYVSSWVNIGAGSCNSDLKNNYGFIKAWTAGKMRDTGRRFLGVIIGSHSKVAINTGFNTGTVVGFNANIVATGFPPKFIPSFTWQVQPEFQEFDLSKAIKTAKTMMSRRDVEFTEATERLFKAIHRFVKQSGFTI